MIEKNIDRERVGDRDRNTQVRKDKDTHRALRDRQTDRNRERQTKKETERETEGQTDRDRQRQTDRQTERVPYSAPTEFTVPKCCLRALSVSRREVGAQKRVASGRAIYVPRVNSPGSVTGILQQRGGVRSEDVLPYPSRIYTWFASPKDRVCLANRAVINFHGDS